MFADQTSVEKAQIMDEITQRSESAGEKQLIFNIMPR